MLRLFFTISCFFFTILSYSQIKISTAEVFIQSRHVWRGRQLGKSIALEPSVTLTSNRFSFNVWAAVTPDNSYSEVDLVPSYQFRKFKVTLFDYYNPVPHDQNQYLNFKNGASRHSLELSLDNFSVDDQRLKWMVGTFLAGDRNQETGNPFYSTYVEFRYPFSVWKVTAEPFVGLTPLPGFYANRLAIINSGLTFSKYLDLKLRFKVPVSLSFISNPYERTNFIILGVGMKF